MSDAVQDLPGLDMSVIERSSDDEAIMSDCKHYTAERYIKMHPEEAERARRMFFDNPLTSLREICSTCKMESRTLNALIVLWTNARGVDFLQERVRIRLAMTAFTLVDRLAYLVEDPAACKKAGINGIAAAIRQILDMAKRTSEHDSNTNTQTDSTSLSGMDYAKFYRTNGLDLKKNSARVVEVVEGSERTDSSGDQVDNRHASADNNSILLSGGYKDLQGISPTVDKLDAKTGADGSMDGVTDPPTDGHGADGEPADGKRPDSGG